MVDLPRRSDSSVPRPKATAGFPNGKIPGEHLVGCGLRNKPGGSEWLMVEPAASAMAAMVAAAANAGVELSSSGTWRSYQGQVNLFTQRFSRVPRGARSKRWDGHNWWPKRGFKVFAAATPGTSNHGKGLAADLSRRVWNVRVTDVELRWLAANGPSFGFWNTVKGEPFHWTYCLGDGTTDAVGEPRGGGGTAPAPSADWDTIKKLAAELSAIEYPGALEQGLTNSAPVMAVQWKLHAAGYGIKVDGDFGTNTWRALTKFEQSNGLLADGVVDVVVWGLLGLPGGSGGAPPLDGTSLEETEVEVGPATFTTSFGPGSSGDEVAAVQTKLTSFGYTVEKNGRFGPRTVKAVTHFQEVNGREPTGHVDQAFWDLLDLP